MEHPTADMIYEKLRSRLPNLSLGTVYRNLRYLEEMGKVRRISTKQSMERYDARCEEHAHFICDICGSVKDMDRIDMQAVEQACHMENGDTIQWMDLFLGGKCKNCSAAASV